MHWEFWGWGAGEGPVCYCQAKAGIFPSGCNLPGAASGDHLDMNTTHGGSTASSGTFRPKGWRERQNNPHTVPVNSRYRAEWLWVVGVVFGKTLYDLTQTKDRDVNLPRDET